MANATPPYPALDELLVPNSPPSSSDEGSNRTVPYAFIEMSNELTHLMFPSSLSLTSAAPEIPTFVSRKDIDRIFSNAAKSIQRLIKFDHRLKSNRYYARYARTSIRHLQASRDYLRAALIEGRLASRKRKIDFIDQTKENR